MILVIRKRDRLSDGICDRVYGTRLLLILIPLSPHPYPEYQPGKDREGRYQPADYAGREDPVVVRSAADYREDER